ncbi:hypothetical protein quinque_006411 [Culex quinquefasciatus]|uniref:SET and MYND domain-containing protein 4-like n=1 Tax=Culex quinquefasciatus TaxID=7176 RepID=UPI0018E29630|nr:SET and MYND domain-containing protein 4-like [Culex quinquefasciatus]XP_038109282.1 SET and MYND domain-containing protein 4-like [Culex quinquefasciatus]
MPQSNPHGLNPVFKLRPLKLLDLDVEHEADTYDAYDQFLRNHPLMSDDALPSWSKCNKRAARVRNEGNRFFQPLDIIPALGKYNESICHAKADSEDLGFGYANRSAVYHEMGEYEHALVNIRLAKKHNYPERLMSKLTARENNCKQRLAAGQSKGIGDPCPRMNINVQTNPKIPFLAKGIHMEVLPKFGRSMMANRNFKTGDVILDEKCILAVVDAEHRYHQCSHCTTGNAKMCSLMPCPHCVSAMYCSEKCLERDWKYVHRFECAVSDKLQYISFSYVAMGSKLFLYGLSLFNDDLDEMMRYFETLEKSGGNALDLDYTEYDPLEEWKDLCNIKPVPSSNDNFARTAAAAHCFTLLKNPVVAAIVNTPAKRTFMYQRVRDFVRLANLYKWENFQSPLCPVASLFNHSCDPNAIATIHSGQVRIIVLRPIRSGQQICVSYGPSWWDDAIGHHHCKPFNCKCVVCDPETKDNWRGRVKKPPASFNRDVAIVGVGFLDDRANNAVKYNAVTQFIVQYAYLHPQRHFGVMLRTYQDILRSLTVDGELRIHRTKAHAELDMGNE